MLVDGQPAKASLRLRGGERIEVDVPEAAPEAPEPQELPLRILHEDPSLLIVDKEAGVVVHPGAGIPDQTLVNAILFHLGKLEGMEEELRPGIVHRLDKETSGCLVVAKDERSLQRLQEEFRSRKVEKIYLALVHGSPREERRTIDTAYGRHPRVRTRFTSKDPVGQPRRAISHLRVVERFAGASLVEVELETGRTHQIRVHLSEAGHPLLADATYGGTRLEKGLSSQAPARLAARAIGRQALHAQRLCFDHPTSGERVCFEAPLPPDFEEALRILRG